MVAAAGPVRCLRRLFEREPCWTIETLADELEYSIPSVRRFLSQAGYYSSFTHNSKWYTLASTPRFDRDGLWFKDQIGFSRQRSLTRTLVRLASRSPAGLTAAQMGGALHCRCHAVLAGLHRRGRLRRERVGRTYVYLAPEPVTAESQRQALIQRARTAAPLPAEIAVLILAEFIRQPGASSSQLASALAQGHNVQVSPVQIDLLFTEHGIKKTG